MTAREIVEQIKTLPETEKAEVIRLLNENVSLASEKIPDFTSAAEEVFARHAELFRKLAQ